MVSWHIEPVAAPNDSRGIVTVELAANATDLLNASFVPNPMSEEQQQVFLEWRVKIHENFLTIPGAYYYKAVDPGTNTIIAAAKWLCPQVLGDPGGSIRSRSPPSFLDVDAHESASSQMRTQAQALGFAQRADLWRLQMLAVHPDYQRRGIATELVQKGLSDLVDRAEQEAYVEASPAGKRVYEKCGFVEEGSLSMMADAYVVSYMVRPAESEKGKNGEEVGKLSAG